jgi:cobalamin biosynthesis Mg chelatase CobN
VKGAVRNRKGCKLMAHIAKKLHTSKKPVDSAKFVGMKGTGDTVYAAHPHETEPTRSAIQQAVQSIAGVPKDTKHSVGDTFRVTRDRAAEAYSDLSYKSRYLARHLGDSSQQLKEERPLQLLTVIAGAAFVVGVFVRVWRLRRYEY